MPPRATVVIPSWNGRLFLPGCLDSLARQSFRDFEVLVVDNGSTDGSIPLLRERYPEVTLIPLQENLGFSAAVNAGILASDTEFVVLLNNDTEPDPDWLAALVRAAEAHPEAGLFASKLLDHRDRSVLDGAGDALRRGGLPYRLGHRERDRGQYDRPALVFGACAAAALYRREVFETVGLFDEDFFAYCEDGDLSFRAQLAGFRCRYTPGAVVHHIGSASTGGKRSATATRLGTQNGVNLLVKNLPRELLPGFLPYFVAAQLARLAVCATSPRTLKAHLAGLRGAAGMYRKMRAKRREVQAGRRVSTGYVRQLLAESSRRANASLRRRMRERVRERLGDRFARGGRG